MTTAILDSILLLFNSKVAGTSSRNLTQDLVNRMNHTLEDSFAGLLSCQVISNGLISGGGRVLSSRPLRFRSFEEVGYSKGG